MGADALTDDRLGIDEAELLRLGRAVDRLLGGRPLLPHGPHARRLRAGRGLEILELRPYAPGDDPRDLDWRATARTARPMVRRYQDEGLSTAYVCLDRSASMHTPGGEKWRLASQLAAALGFLFLRAGNRVGLLTFSAGVDLHDPPARGRNAYARLLRRLRDSEARTRGGATRLEPCIPFVPRGGCALVVSDFLAPDFLAGGLQGLFRREVRVEALQILGAGDVPRISGPRALLRDVETGESRTVGSHETQRAQESLRALHLGLASHCRERGISLTPCRPEQGWRVALLEHLQLRRGEAR